MPFRFHPECFFKKLELEEIIPEFNISSSLIGLDRLFYNDQLTVLNLNKYYSAQQSIEVIDRNKTGNRKRKMDEESEDLSHTSKKIKIFETDEEEKNYQVIYLSLVICIFFQILKVKRICLRLKLISSGILMKKLNIK